MPKLPLPLNLPLKVRGIKGVICIIFITPPPAKEFPPAKPWRAGVRRAGLAPLILRGESLKIFLRREFL
jgi:hypothetical protein